MKGVHLVIINSFLNFFFKIPQLFFIFYNIYQTFIPDSMGSNFLDGKYRLYCNKFEICNTIFVISNFLFIITLNLNFYVFYCFDRKFQESFYNLKLIFVK